MGVAVESFEEVSPLEEERAVVDVAVSDDVGVVASLGLASMMCTGA